MSQTAVTILVAAIAAVPGVSAAFIALRAQRRSEETAEKASVIEGYDEFTAHLQAEVRETKVELRETKAELHETRIEVRALRRQNDDQAAELRDVRSQLSYVRVHLGEEEGWDPRHDGVPLYGRRSSDGPLLPDGSEWAVGTEDQPHPTEEP
jgi:septal ring factor EnvC (AmiA/AmiB activator)